MRLLHHYPTLSHSFLRNATRLFGFREIYRLVAVHASQRKKNDAFYNEKEKRCVSQRKKTAVFHNEKRPPRFTTKKDRYVSQRSGLIRKY